MRTEPLRSIRWMLALLLALGMAITTFTPSASAGGNRHHGGDRHHGHDKHPGGDDGFTLTILHNNDGESAVLPSGTDDEEAGVARFATLLRDEKRAAVRGGNRDDGVIYVSSGDNFLASPSFTASLEDGVFYDAIALDMLGYDAIALGNHDFDFGPDVLADFIDDFRKPGKPPYLSSNLDFSAEAALQALVDSDVIAKSTIVRERGERIGIIGATTENLPFISSPRNVVVNAVQPAIEAEVAALQSDGIDKIILISHLQDIEGDIALAENLTGVDVMIAGGGDELLANLDDPLLPSDQEDCLPDVDNDEDTCNPDGVPDAIFGPYPELATDADGATVPVVTTSGQYGYLGKLVVDFDEDGNVTGFDGGPLRVVDESVGPDGVRDDRRMQRRVVEPVAEFVAALATEVIAQTEVELDGRRSPGVRTMETNEGNLIADSQLWQATQLAADFGQPVPDVALQNGGGIRNDSIIALGADPGATQDITELDTFDMVPFANLVVIVPDIPRSQFKEILENAVSRTQPGDTPGGTGRFAQVAGFSFVFDGSGTAQVLNSDGTVAVAGTRVTDVQLDDGTDIVVGGVVQAGADLTIATIDFSARGGDEYPYRGAPFAGLGVSYQQALSNYIQAPTADGGLGGLIGEADYPEGGEGRITEL